MDTHNAQPRQLHHVYWLGGGSGAGKSTLARRLADAYDLHLYSTDEAMSDHGRRCTPDDSPLLEIFKEMDMDERWVNRPPQTMLDTFHWFQGEGFHLIVEDLLQLPPERGVLVEGFRLLPHRVKPWLYRTQGIWLIPTPTFRRMAFTCRGTLWNIAGRTSDPQRALEQLLERDRLFTDRIEREAQELGLPTIAVHRSLREEELAALVATKLGLKRLHEGG
ncbi:MAG: hypothetical protein AAFX99_08960 [Myxococcota bacterium]